jgi:hypothetical protein
VLCEAIELALPKPAIGIQPPRGLPQRSRLEPDATHASIAPPLHEMRPLEHAQVLADRRERHGKGPGELADGGVSGGKTREHRPAGRVRECAEDGIERRLMVNHMVYYSARRERGQPEREAGSGNRESAIGNGVMATRTPRLGPRSKMISDSRFPIPDSRSRSPYLANSTRYETAP